MAKKISKSSMGIAFHTKYTGKDMASMKASFNVTKNSFKTNSKVLVEDATYFDQSGRASFTAAEMKSVTKEVAKARQLTDANKRGLDWLAGENKIVALLNIYANSTVKAGDLTLRYTDFVAMIKERYEEDAAKLKREANQKNKIAQGKQLISTIQRNKKSMDGIFKLHSVLNKATLLLINKLEGIKSYKTFLKRADGFEVTGEEGFVASDHLGNVIKLVDRLQFSRANMTIAKNWIKG
jgi:DNA polymerase II small subunit/DNA polymerase delta subunit B